MRSDSTFHLIIPFAASSASGWLQAMQAMPQGSMKRLGQLLQGMKLLETDAREAETLSPPHERALARALGLAAHETPDGLIPWAARAATASLPGASGKGWAWITPCHWAMGHLQATLTDPAALDLREDESRRLLALMQPYFETDGITLHYLAPDRWLAEAELFRTLPTASLDRVLARDVDAWLPDGRAAAPLRRLQNEMQMLLYTHPLNDERDSRRQLRVNSLWISGTGALPDPAMPRATTEVSAPRSLAEAVFRDDWTAYVQAWEQLGTGEIARLLERQRAGETVRLTLCGELSAATYETDHAGLWHRISRLFSHLPPLDGLNQL